MPPAQPTTGVRTRAGEMLISRLQPIKGGILTRNIIQVWATVTKLIHQQMSSSTPPEIFD